MLKRTEASTPGRKIRYIVLVVIAMGLVVLMLSEYV